MMGDKKIFQIQDFIRKKPCEEPHFIFLSTKDMENVYGKAMIVKECLASLMDYPHSINDEELAHDWVVPKNGGSKWKLKQSTSILCS
jgi:hypothetical protein